MILIGWLCLALGAVGSLAQAPPPLEWWQTTVFYQIYPRSYQDSNGDGTGDLNGITARLDHLKDLGVGAIWISPIYKSPMADFGYDIADFKQIDPTFGTIEEFDALIARAKELDIKVVLDFVPNHSSDENEWFIKSAANDPQYSDYYVWKDPKGFTEEGEPIPPNNWLSVFLGPAWQYNENRNQFYLHTFLVKQPDLNYRNPALVQEMKDVLTFWLDHGVSGFRVDAIPGLVEDIRFLDEPPSNIPGVPPDDPNSLDHIYTVNQPETYDMVQQWRELLDEYSKKDNISRVMMTEAYAGVKETMDYYGTETRRGAHFTFNFYFITSLNADSSAQDFSNIIDLWLDNMPSWAWANWVIGNHDNHRVATRYSSELSDSIIMITMMLPGTAVTYNGEEIAMVDTHISYEDTLDTVACNAGPDRYEQFSRDPERTPFQWDSTINAGFSTANKTWLPVNSNYQQLNLEAQKEANISHYHLYKSLVLARQSQTIQRGNLQKTVTGNVLVLLRELEGGDSFLVVVNFGDETVVIDLTEAMPNLPSTMEVYTASGGSNLDVGSAIALSSVSLPSEAGVVLTTLSAN